MTLRLSSVLLTALAIASSANAQMRGGHAGFGSPGGPVHARLGRPILLGDPFYYTDYYPPEGYLAQAPPQVIVLQALPPAAPEPETKLEPLLIEWQGDHYARYGGGDSSQGRATSVHTDYSEPTSRPTQPASHVLQPAVLVYRDGHREDVPQYAIVGSSIYAKGDYLQDGYWTKTIQLSTLNLPATIRANQDNGVKFVLPAGPNEVVTRP